jgi:bacterioferritin
MFHSESDAWPVFTPHPSEPLSQAVMNKSKEEGKATAIKTLREQPGAFRADMEEIRRRARQHIERGAITEGYKADREAVMKVLNEALATERVCVLRYKRHYYMASGIHAQAVAEEFLEHAEEEQKQADAIAERVTQLAGARGFNPEGLQTRSHSEYVEGNSLVDMIREDLIAERIAIDSDGEIIQYLGNDDPTSRRVMEKILANEEEHAEELKTLLQAIGSDESDSATPRARERTG